MAAERFNGFIVTVFIIIVAITNLVVVVMVIDFLVNDDVVGCSWGKQQTSLFGGVNIPSSHPVRMVGRAAGE